MKKYTFRKMYFKVTDDRVIADNVWSIDAYQRRDDAIRSWSDYGKLTPYYWEQGKPLPKRSVEGFYLVHESLFEEILAKYAGTIIDASEATKSALPDKP